MGEATVINLRMVLQRCDDTGILMVEIPEIGLISQADPDLEGDAETRDAYAMIFEAASLIADADEEMGLDVFDRSGPSFLLGEDGQSNEQG